MVLALWSVDASSRLDYSTLQGHREVVITREQWLQVFRSWAQLRTQLTRVRILVIGVEGV